MLFLQFMIAWTWYTGVRTSGQSDFLLMKWNRRLSSDGEDTICWRVKHSSLSHSTNCPWTERGIISSADASCWPWTLQRSLSFLSSFPSIESAVKTVPAGTVKFSNAILEQLVKVKGRLDSIMTGLRVTISSIELNGISSGTILNKPEKTTVVS